MNPPLQPKMKLSTWALVSVSVMLTLFWLYQSIPLALAPTVHSLSLVLMPASLFTGIVLRNDPRGRWFYLGPLLFFIGLIGSIGPWDFSQEFLYQAARTGDTRSLKGLMDSDHLGPDVVDSHGNSLLMKAAQYGHTDTVKELLRRGARTDYRDRDGDTALSVAQRYHHTEIVELLQKAGAKR